MANILNLLATLVFAYVIYPGKAQCSLSNIVITQTPTEQLVCSQPEYEVTITKTCPCQLSSVKLDINGFQTVEPVDSSILDKDGFVNNMMPLPSEGLKFKYAASAMFQFKPISSQVSCF